MVNRTSSAHSATNAARSGLRGSSAARGGSKSRQSKHAAPLQAHLESDELLDEYKRYYRIGSEVDLQLRLTRGFTLVNRRWRKYLDEHLRRIGQSQARWEALFAVAMTREGSALGTIAKRVGVEGPTFVRMISLNVWRTLSAVTSFTSILRILEATAPPTASMAMTRSKTTTSIVLFERFR